MGYAVYHMEKGKGGSGGIGKHIDRKESINGYTTFEHHNRKKTKNNKSYILNKHCEKSLPQAIKDRIKEGYKGEKAIRKDAVRFQTHILTGSHEQMKEIFADEKRKEQWIEANKQWMQERYGKENIVRFTLHVDEKTPHIHAVTVPLTRDGRLSAKEYANGKKALRDMQTDYANKMEQFDLKRGLERTGISHETATEYYARQKEAENVFKKKSIGLVQPTKKIFGIANRKEIVRQNKELANMAVGLVAVNHKQSKELKEAVERADWMQGRTEHAESEKKIIHGILNDLDEKLKDPNYLKTELKELERQENERRDWAEEERIRERDRAEREVSEQLKQEAVPDYEEMRNYLYDDDIEEEEEIKQRRGVRR